MGTESLPGDENRICRNCLELFETVFQHMSEGVVITDKNGDILFVNRAFEMTTGYLKEEVLSQNPRLLQSGRHDHLYYKTMWEYISKKGRWEGEIWNRRKSGEVYPERLRIHSVFDSEGTIVNYIGVFSDIGEEKQKEEEQRLAHKVFENTSEGIMITDINGKILSVNPAFSVITGYSPDEVIGRNPRFLRSGRHEQDFYDEMWSKLLREGTWQGEIWDKRKDGEIYAELLSISSVKDHTGETVNYIAIFSDITKQKELEEQLQYLAEYDSLTGLPNRRLFAKEFERLIQEAEEQGTLAAIFYLDLDKFKWINDTHGHATGDLFLQEVAKRLIGCLRKSDLVARLGGDEFVVMVSDLNRMEDAVRIAQKIRDCLRPPFHIENVEISIQVSIGISMFPNHGDNKEILLRNADRAMYHSKKKGSFCQIFSSELCE